MDDQSIEKQKNSNKKVITIVCAVCLIVLITIIVCIIVYFSSVLPVEQQSFSDAANEIKNAGTEWKS